MKRTGWIIALVAISPAAHAQIPAFPGAEGAGMWSEGGRGGTVYEVVNLNDSGAGSLRAAVEADEPRFVVFRVGGNIELASTLSIRNPRIYIAGQTAPGDGIVLKNYPLSIRTDHVIVRHLRVRPADNENAEVDALAVIEGSDIIVDHCSTSWSVDETLSVTGEDLDRVTIQWCIISESLHCSVHSKGCHGMGSLVRGGWGHQYTYHHNLYAHHNARSPRPGNYNTYTDDPAGLVFDFRNNVIYNWGGDHAGYNSDADSITKMNFVGNCYRPGPDSTDSVAFRENCTYALGFFDDNSMSGTVPGDPWSLVEFSSAFTSGQIASYQQASPFAVEAVTTEPAASACTGVLADVGATLPARDAVDARIVADVENGTGSIIDDEDEVGGWPDLQDGTPPPDDDHDGMPNDYETAYGFDPSDPADGNLDCDSDGYTNIEEFLNGGPGADPCSGSGGSGGGAGVAGSGQGAQGGSGASGLAGGAGGVGTAPGMDDADSGCGCRVAESRSSAVGWWWIAALGLVAARRGRRT